MKKFSFMVTGDRALFTDPVTRVGGEKFSYHIPTYEAIKGVCKSLYWKPSLVWIVDRVRIMNPIQTATIGIKCRKWHKAGCDLFYYTYLRDVAYQVEAHWEWNIHRPELKHDWNERKHCEITERYVRRGGSKDVFLGTRECQCDVIPVQFGSGAGFYDTIEEMSYGMMFHSFGYPDETGNKKLVSHLWHATMRHGIITFPRPEMCVHRREIKPMDVKTFVPGINYTSVQEVAS